MTHQGNQEHLQTRDRNEPERLGSNALRSKPGDRREIYGIRMETQAEYGYLFPLNIM